MAVPTVLDFKLPIEADETYIASALPEEPKADLSSESHSRCGQPSGTRKISANIESVLENGTRCEEETFVSNRYQDIAEHLQAVLNELDLVISRVDPTGPLSTFHNRISVAKNMLADLHGLAASAGNPPDGIPQKSKAYSAPTKTKGKSTQAEAVKFILKRYLETGGLVPISAKEIFEGTPSIHSQTNVYTVLSQLVHDGKLVSYRAFGFGGYLPTKLLFEEALQGSSL